MKSSFIFTVVAILSIALIVPAEAGYTFTVVEDYADENGEPALDPVFNHSLPDGSYYTIEDCIYHHGGGYYTLLLLEDLVDTITFNLEPDWTIIEATVESINAQTALFTGTSGSLTFTEEIPNNGPYYWTVTAQEIGSIESIQLQTGQGHFGNITLTISAVPEPSVLWLLAGGMPLLLFFFNCCKK